MERIAVLIPCYNEANTVSKVVSDFRSVLPDAKIYVYDNNSNDDTDVIAKKSGAIVRHEYKQGKGNVIRRAFREVDAEIYVLVDGDDTYSAKDVTQMITLLVDNKADMVIGDRLSGAYFEENKRLFHNVGNRIVRKAINSLFHASINDIMTGYRVFSYEFVKTFPVLSNEFEIETEMTIHAIDKKLAVNEIVIEYKDRPIGSVSKLNTYLDGLKVILKIISMYKNYKPFVFWGMIGSACGVLSIMFVAPIITEFLLTGLVARFPTLFVCGFVMVMAILFIMTGIILEAFRVRDKEQFEFKYNLMSQIKRQRSGE